MSIELKEEVKADTSIRDYKLFDDMRLVAWWTRAVSPNDNPAAKQWHGEWIPATDEQLDTYNISYMKRKFFAKVINKSVNLHDELARAVSELKSRYGKEV